MMMKFKYKYIHIALGLAMLIACSSQDEVIVPADDDQIIHVCDVSTAEMMTASATTRATVDAGSLNWLKTGLEAGMNIYYFKGTVDQHAILKLETNGKYSLKTSAGAYCRWLDNGEHTFEGVFAPVGLKDKNTSQIYDDLIHYTAIPPSNKINATIDYITIPLQHRLARVQAYVLIDTDMSTTLKGYDKDDDNNNYTVENTLLRFCNVQTLDYIDDGGHPIWKKERKAIPHYLGKLGSIVEDNKVAFETFRTYKKKSTGELFFPTDGEWKTAHKAYEEDKQGEASGYICTDYGKVPSYDLIVRPTYSKATDNANVMYDEDGYVTKKADIEALKNNIDFELTLDNDLEYEKSFTFDLNANDETVVFLRVSPERIDYNSTGSRLWKESSYGDAYYGVNNKNGNELSKAGSSWQRAYTNSTKNDGVTDGHKYDADTEDLEAQYVTNERFIKLLKEANANGTHDGHYFILQNDITIDVTEFPADFVFTGHLDALDHTITLSGTTESRNWLFGGIGTGWTSEILNAKIDGGVLFSSTANILGHINNCWNGAVHIPDVTPAIPTY